MVKERRRPRFGTVLGDYALLAAIVLVGAMPVVGWLLRYPVERWEVGLGTAMILGAGAELARELLARRAPPPDDASRPSPPPS